MSKTAVGQFSTNNTLLEDSSIEMSFPVATDKNADTVAYYAKIYWQPIYCSVSANNYISIETTDTVRVNDELALTTEPDGVDNLKSTITLNFANKLTTDVRIYVVITARDNISGHSDTPPILTSGYYYVIRHQTPIVSLSSAEWTSGGIKEIRLNGNITDYGFTTPGNLSTLLASSSTWQAWRVGLETALGTIDLTFSFKVSYSSDNITFSEPDVYDITVTKELLNATSSTAAYTNDATFTLIFNKDETTPVPIDSILKGNSYFFKAYIISNYFTLSLDPDADSILLISNTPLFIMRDGIVQVNLPKNTTATTGAVMAARGPKQDATIGQSLALYDFHTRAGESEVADNPSLGFFDSSHNLMASISVERNEADTAYEATLNMNNTQVPIGGSGVPIGTVTMWMTNTAPDDWLFADNGATYNIEDYPDLAALWGTSFGGNGTTTFGVPNMKGRSPIALDPNNSVLDTIGKTAGNLTCTIQTANLPPHNHSMAHSHAIDHDHASTTSGNESAGHTHSISITSGNESANHTHTINHDHASFNTEYTGSHTHVASTGSYKVGSGSTSTYSYKTDSGSTSPTDTGPAGSHYHTIDVPSYSGSSGNTSASHTHSVSGTSGATSASHTHAVDLPSYTGTSGASSAADTGTAGTGTAIDILHPVFVVRYIVKAL